MPLLEQGRLARSTDVLEPSLVGVRSVQEILQPPSTVLSGRLDPRHRTATADDDEALAIVLDCVENVREPPSSIGRTQTLHKIRLSELPWIWLVIPRLVGAGLARPCAGAADTPDRTPQLALEREAHLSHSAALRAE